MLTAGLLLLCCGFVVLFVSNATRAALPELILDLGRDPSERRRAAAVNLRILWFARFAALLSCGAGVVLSALSPALRAPAVPGWAIAVVLSCAVLLLGELLPSRLGHTRPAPAVRAFRIPFLALRILFYLPVRLLLGRMSPEDPASEWAFTPPDFLWLEQRYEKDDGEDLDQERELMDGIVDFSDKIVREVMVPRIDMVCMEMTDDLDSVVRQALEAGHSRIPVYRERIDDIAGVLYAKDLLRFLAGRAGSFHMEKVLRQAYFVPEYKRIDDLFREFQKHRIHMAIVVDEYGGTAGLVTMEDIVEEVFGEILDEYDDSQAPLVQSLALGAYRIDAMLPMDDLNGLLGTSWEEGDVETAGGLVYSALGHIPRPGEQVSLRGFVFTVEKVRGQRILLLKVAPEATGGRAENP